MSFLNIFFQNLEVEIMKIELNAKERDSIIHCLEYNAEPRDYEDELAKRIRKEEQL